MVGVVVVVVAAAWLERMAELAAANGREDDGRTFNALLADSWS